MGKLKAALESGASRPQQQMRIDQILEELDDEDQKALRAALASAEFGNKTIARILSQQGHSCSGDSVKSWRDKNLGGS